MLITSWVRREGTQRRLGLPVSREEKGDQPWLRNTTRDNITRGIATSQHQKSRTERERDRHSLQLSA